MFRAFYVVSLTYMHTAIDGVITNESMGCLYREMYMGKPAPGHKFKVSTKQRF